MTAAIEIVVPCRKWAQAVPGLERLCRRFALAALAATESSAEHAAPDAELRIALTDDAAARDLNRRFRGIDKATNVLSFPAHGPDTRRDADPQGLGDILVAFETTACEAKAQGVTTADHLAHLLVHGALHLRGHDHERAADAEIMEALETDVLARFGIADPYRGTFAERPS